MGMAERASPVADQPERAAPTPICAGSFDPVARALAPGAASLVNVPETRLHMPSDEP